MKRRGFLGWVAGAFGALFGGAVVAAPSRPRVAVGKLKPMVGVPLTLPRHHPPVVTGSRADDPEPLLTACSDCLAENTVRYEGPCFACSRNQSDEAAHPTSRRDFWVHVESPQAHGAWGE